MTIDDFLSVYKHGNKFEIVKLKKISQPCTYNNTYVDGYHSLGIYILCNNSEIVYIGSSGNLHHRLTKHRSKLKTDEIYVWIINPDFLKATAYEINICNTEEQRAINIAKPILNTSKFILYEDLWAGGPQDFDFVIGYVTCLNQLTNQNVKRNEVKFLQKALSIKTDIRLRKQ